jgi:hypothetical protein
MNKIKKSWDFLIYDSNHLANFIFLSYDNTILRFAFNSGNLNKLFIVIKLKIKK